VEFRDLEIAVVGARGAVGSELLALLASRGVAATRVRALGRAASAGQRVPFGAQQLELRPADTAQLSGAQLVFLAAGAEAARELAPMALDLGARVIDASSAFREDPQVPLVLPEVNGGRLRTSRSRLVASPNCTTTLAVLATDPLRRAFGLRRMVLASYQAVSGAGRRAMDELRRQTAEALAGRTTAPQVFAEPCAFNLFSHDSAVDPHSGQNLEEQKLARESARLWGDGETAIAATCVRVPVLRVHCLALQLELVRPASEEEVRAALDGAPGLAWADDRELNRFPTPARAEGRREVLIGRLRPDPSLGRERDGRGRGFGLFVAGDQLLKGAALNCLQIAECW
jgi:aspartate-semialdehyde dehydrogenase